MRRFLPLALLLLPAPVFANPDAAARRLPVTTQVFASGDMLPPPEQTAELLNRIQANPAVDWLTEQLPFQLPPNFTDLALGWVQGEITVAWVRSGERSVVDQFNRREQQELAYQELERKLGYLGPEVERFRKKFKRLPTGWNEMVVRKVRKSVPTSPHGEFVLLPTGVTVRYRGELQLAQLAAPPLWKFGGGLQAQKRQPHPPSNVLVAIRSADDAKCREALRRLVEAGSGLKAAQGDTWTWQYAENYSPLTLQLQAGYLVASDNAGLVTRYLGNNTAEQGLDTNPRYQFQRRQLPDSEGDSTFAFLDLEDLLATTSAFGDIPQAAKACRSLGFVYHDTPSNTSILPTAGRAEGMLQLRDPVPGTPPAALAFLDDVSADSQVVYALHVPTALRLVENLAPADIMVGGLWQQFQADSGINATTSELAASTGWLVMETDVLDDIVADLRGAFDGDSEEGEDNLVKWLSNRSGAWTLQVPDATMQDKIAAALWQKTGDPGTPRVAGKHRYWMRSNGSWGVAAVPQKLLASSRLSRRLLLRTLQTMSLPGSGLSRHTSLDDFRSRLQGNVVGFTSQKSDWLYALIKGVLLLLDGQSRPEAEVLGRYRDTYAALTVVPEGFRLYSSFYSDTPLRPVPPGAPDADLVSLQQRMLHDYHPVAATPAAGTKPYSACKSNLKNIATGLEMWASDHQGKYPERLSQLTPDYLKTLPTCPAAGQDTYSAHYKRRPAGFSVYCWGHHHKDMRVQRNRPAYNSEQGLVEK
jgi:hypothetical protein